MARRDAVAPDVANVIVGSVYSVHMAIGCLSETVRTIAISKGVIIVFGQLEILMDVLGFVHLVCLKLDIVPLVRLCSRAPVYVGYVETPHNERRRVRGALCSHAFFAGWYYIFPHESFLGN